MPINNIKSPEGIYMKINELTPQKTEIKREIQKGRPQEQPKENEQLKITQDQVQLSIKPAIENAKAKVSSCLRLERKRFLN